MPPPRRNSVQRGSGLAALSIDVAEKPAIDYEWVELADVPALLEDPTTIVVDVRTDEERADGFLRGSAHAPSTEWEEAPQDTVSKLIGAKDPTSTRLVFHCMYSRERAPRAAMAAVQASPEVKVAILRGGFQGCMAQLWRERPEYFDGVKPERWVEFGRQGLVWAPDANPSAYVAELLAANTQQAPAS